MPLNYNGFDDEGSFSADSDSDGVDDAGGCLSTKKFEFLNKVTRDNNQTKRRQNSKLSIQQLDFKQSTSEPPQMSISNDSFFPLSFPLSPSLVLS